MKGKNSYSTVNEGDENVPIGNDDKDVEGPIFKNYERVGVSQFWIFGCSFSFLINLVLAIVIFNVSKIPCSEDQIYSSQPFMELQLNYSDAQLEASACVDNQNIADDVALDAIQDIIEEEGTFAHVVALKKSLKDMRVSKDVYHAEYIDCKESKTEALMNLANSYRDKQEICWLTTELQDEIFGEKLNFLPTNRLEGKSDFLMITPWKGPNCEFPAWRFKDNRLCYLKKHGYDFVVGDSDPDEVLDGDEEIDAEFALELGQSYHWYKVSLARTYLTEQSGYKWGFLTNAEYLITDFNRGLEEFTKDVPDDVHIILPSAGGDNCFVDNYAMFVRNSKIGRSFLEYWWNMREILCGYNDLCPMYNAILALLFVSDGKATSWDEEHLKLELYISKKEGWDSPEGRLHIRNRFEKELLALGAPCREPGTEKRHGPLLITTFPSESNEYNSGVGFNTQEDYSPFDTDKLFAGKMFGFYATENEEFKKRYDTSTLLKDAGCEINLKTKIEQN